MSTLRLVPVLAVLLSACAGWDSATPSYAQPPVQEPVPSHYAPPPPEVIEPAEPEPEPPAAPATGDRVAIASVQLFDDCPEPAPTSGIAQESAPAAESRRAGPAGKPTEGRDLGCAQSMVQLAIQSDRPGLLRIEAVRVLDPATKKVAGSSTLRQPTRWSAELGAYAPWDARVPAATELQASYKLGVFDLSRSAERVGPEFNAFYGPFMLEVDVSIDGRRQTVRSPEFSRVDIHMMVT